MEGDRVSYHDSVLKVYDKIKKDNLALGLYTYVNPVPAVTGAPKLVKLLTEDCQGVTGGLLNVETDAVKAVDAHSSARNDRVVFVFGDW